MFDIDDFSAKEDGRFEASAELIEEIGGMSWGTYNYAGPEYIPKAIRAFFVNLVDDREDVIHFWHQLGF